VRRWLLAGIAGFLVVLAAPTVRDAWQINRAGMLLNRAIVVSADAARAESANGATIFAAGGDYVLTPESEALLQRSLALMEGAASRGPHTAAREVPIWRTYGAAARIVPSDHAFQLLSRSREAGRLDWYGELWFGEVASATGRWDEAADAYRRVDVSNLLVYRAEAHIAAGEKNLALQELALAKASLDALVDREKARLLLLDRTGDEPSSLAGMMQRPAERSTTLFRIGHGFLSLGRPSEALPVLEEALAVAETSSPGAGVMKNLHFDLASALAGTLPENLATAGGDRAYAYYAGAGDLTRLKGVIRVRALVYQALAIDHSAVSCNRAGNLLMGIGDEAMGLSFLTEATTIDPLYPDPYLGIGGWYDLKGMGYAARMVYERAAALMPEQPAIISALAVSTFETAPHERALPLLERAAGMKTNRVAVFAYLGDCYLESGLTAEARAAWEEGLERFPDAEDLTERLDRLSVTIEETP
jgi:tetratricopeptide (TPR) repeat protein